MNRWRKEINRLSKGMPNLYLEVTIEKNWRYQNFHFLSFKNLPPVFGELQLMQISLNFQTPCCNLKIRGLRAEACMWLFCCFYFEKNDDVLRSKSAYILLNKNINYKKETEFKIKNPIHSLRETNLVLQLT